MTIESLGIHRISWDFNIKLRLTFSFINWFLYTKGRTVRMQKAEHNSLLKLGCGCTPLSQISPMQIADGKDTFYFGLVDKSPRFLVLIGSIENSSYLKKSYSNVRPPIASVLGATKLKPSISRIIQSPLVNIKLK